MTNYHRSRTERSIQAVNFSISFVAAVSISIFSGPFFWFWGCSFAGALLVVSAYFAYRYWISMETVDWIENEKGTFLRFRRLNVDRTLSLNELTSATIVPGWGKTILRFSHYKWTIRHQLIRCETLLAHIRLARPELFFGPVTHLTLKATYLTHGILGFFSLGIVTSGILLALNNPLFLLLSFGLASVPVVRILWFTPRQYEIRKGEVTVFYVLRKKVWKSGDLIGFREDAYAAGGCTFFLIRISFPFQNVVLDEGLLMSPLRPYAAWIRHSMQYVPDLDDDLLPLAESADGPVLEELDGGVESI